MNKGRGFPQVRAKWAIGPRAGQKYPPPCWVRFEFGYEFIADPAHPGTITIIGPKAIVAKWKYEQSSANVLWESDWIGTDPLYTGHLRFTQVFGPDDHCTARVKQTFTYAGAFPYTSTWTIDDTLGDGVWGDFGADFGARFAQFGFHDLRLTNFYNHGLERRSYAQLRTLGADAEDTAPMTWNG